MSLEIVGCLPQLKINVWLFDQCFAKIVNFFNGVTWKKNTKKKQPLVMSLFHERMHFPFSDDLLFHFSF